MSDFRIFESRFTVGGFQLDSTLHLSLPVLANHIASVASDHAEQLGIGRVALLEHRQAWVFSRLLIQMDRYPEEYESYTIRS